MAQIRLRIRTRKAWWVGPLYAAGYVWCWLRLPMNPNAFIGLLISGHRVEAVEG